MDKNSQSYNIGLCTWLLENLELNEYICTHVYVCKRGLNIFVYKERVL